MLVYRLQSLYSDTQGAYSVWVEHTFPMDVSNTVDVGGILTDDAFEGSHPDPVNDKLLGTKWCDMLPSEQSQYFFGCSTPEQLFNWFYRTDLYRLIDDHSDAVVAVYEVPDEYVEVGTTQTVFVLDEALKVTTFPLSTFHKQYNNNPVDLVDRLEHYSKLRKVKK